VAKVYNQEVDLVAKGYAQVVGPVAQDALVDKVCVQVVDLAAWDAPVVKECAQVVAPVAQDALAVKVCAQVVDLEDPEEVQV